MASNRKRKVELGKRIKYDGVRATLTFNLFDGTNYKVGVRWRKDGHIVGARNRIDDFDEIMGDFYSRPKLGGPHNLTIAINVDDEPGFESYISGNSQEDGTYTEVEVIQSYYAHMAIKQAALPARAEGKRPRI